MADVQIATLGLAQCIGSSVTGPADLFKTANLVCKAAAGTGTKALPDISWALAGDEAVKTQSGILLAPEISLQDAASSDVVIVPGLGGYEDGTNRTENYAACIKFLREIDDGKRLIVGLCTGTMLLAKAGLLNGREATTSWWNAARFREEFPLVNLNQDNIMTVDRNIVCAGAGASFFDAGLLILERLGGRWLSEMVANYFVLERRRSSQSSYLVPGYLAMSDPVVSRFDQWVRANLKSNISLKVAADILGMSTRTLNRRIKRVTGQSPQKYITAIKMQHARHLVLQKRLSVDEIAYEIGYADSNAFRRVVKSFFGKSVSQLA